MTTLSGFRQRVTARRSSRGEAGELVVDNFAGAGGASLGIEKALGRAVDIAVNHDELAIAMHEANHPGTRHLCESVWDVDPVEVCGGRPVGLAWFSPDCTHFSRAKGGKPVSKRVRGLAWVVIRWAKAVRPRVIMLENVPEFTTWGPLAGDARPCPKRRGETFRSWTGTLRKLGYRVEWRELCAADYGVPTIRKRLFLIARCDGQPIVWPEPTHTRRDKAEALGLLPWLPASGCIDWSHECPSIFDRKRPLAEATQRRIAAGLRRFVLECPEPYIVPIQHYGRVNRGHPVSEPVRTVTAWPKGGSFALCAPTLVSTNHGDSGGRRTYPLDEPMRTVCASSGGGEAVVSAWLAKHYGGVVGHDAHRPIGTITATDHHSVCAAHLTTFYGTSEAGRDVRDPCPTVTSTGTHIAEVRAFITKYFGTGTGQSANDPAHTITAKDRLGLVTVAGVDHVITDIGLRMLQPRELLAAQFGEYAAEYVLLGTKTRQVAAIGNSVPPRMSEVLVRANVRLRRAVAP